MIKILKLHVDKKALGYNVYEILYNKIVLVCPNLFSRMFKMSIISIKTNKSLANIIITAQHFTV